MNKTAYARRGDNDLDRFLKILANPTRRSLLLRLSRSDETVTTVDDLCDTLSTDETGDPPDTDVAETLYHLHLPMLSDIGIVDVDWEQRTVRYRGNPSVEALLEGVERIGLH